MKNVNISNLGLGDKVQHKGLGLGTVIYCTEKPSVKVRFEKGCMTFTQQTAYNLFEA